MEEMLIFHKIINAVYERQRKIIDWTNINVKCFSIILINSYMKISSNTLLNLQYMPLLNKFSE